MTIGICAVAGSRCKLTHICQPSQTDPSVLVKGDRDLVGRQVDINGATVSRMGKNHGFWIESGGASVYVLVAQPATGTAATASPGKKVAIDELVLRMPHGMRDRARTMTNANEDIYGYATDVK